MIVYLVINKANGKRYVGQTQRSLSQRWSRHLTAARRGNPSFLAKAIRKYGECEFEVVILCNCSSKDEMDVRERAFIRMFDTRDSRYGYNLTEGGEGSWGYKHTPESKQKIRAIQLGRKRGPRPPRSPEWCQKLSLAKKGKKQSQEQIRNAAAARTGLKRGPISEEHRQKLRVAKLGNKNALGHVCSLEARQKISAANQRRYGSL